MDPREAPIVGIKIIKEIYNLVEVLDEYDAFFGQISIPSIMSLLDRFKADAYLIEDFWKTGGITDDELAEAIRRRILTRSDLYHIVDVGSTVNLMTVHAAKGKEFMNVIVRVNQRNVNIYEPKEIRVLYIACTRAKESLAVFVPQSYAYDRTRSNTIDTMSLAAGFI
jgi:superfamily I DNA/RNA helicase